MTKKEIPNTSLTVWHHGKLLLLGIAVRLYPVLLGVYTLYLKLQYLFEDFTKYCCSAESSYRAAI